jgi:hypothetical protein
MYSPCRFITNLPFDDLNFIPLFSLPQPEGDSQNIDFSSNPEIFAYVPQLKFGGHPFPYLCCDIDDLDQDLIGWNDTSHSYDYYNLLFEIPHRSLRRSATIDSNTRDFNKIADSPEYNEALASSLQSRERTSIDLNPEGGTGVEVNAHQTGERKTPLYSIVKHYPMPWQIELSNQKKNQQP